MIAEDKVCAYCKRRPADFFEILQDDGTYRDWCSKCCFELSIALPLAFSDKYRERVAKGKCDFCGKQPVGISRLGRGAAGEERLQLWCRHCGQDLKQWAKLQESRIDPARLYNESIETLLRVREEHKCEYMKQRVAERNRGNG